MSDVNNNNTTTTSTTAAPVADTPAADTPVATSSVEQPEQSSVADAPKTDAVAEPTALPTESEAAPVTKDDEAPVEDKKDEAAALPEKKPIEPITEGQLAVKGPGLLKSIIPSKKEFWLDDSAVAPQDLSSYMRGEKPEIAHPVVAWASQTGKGLLFFNKKGDTTRKQPGHVLALYDATDLKKQAPHEVAFKLHGQEHVLKATGDAERDGWYLSIEKGIEMGKAAKEEVRESEGYKAEMEKLNKPVTSAVTTAAAAKRSQSQPKKSMEADKTDAAAAAERKNSDVVEDDKKDKKARSTSRGVLGRLKSKKDDLETKKDEKKEEKNVEEEPKTEDHKTEEIAGGAAVVGAAAGTAAVVGASSDDKEETTESTPTEVKKDEPKPAKRGSIFGKMQGWGSVKSPAKEKDQKEAELKPDVPPKDTAVVAETAPQLPETSTEPAEETPVADAEAKPEAVEKKEEPTSATTPGKEKSNFLSGLPFMNKRNRSVSPSANMKEAPKTEETAAAATTEAPKETEAAPAPAAEETKTDDVVPAVAETAAIEPLKPTEESTTAAAATTSTTPNKRQSVLGNLGRRASKAFKGINSPSSAKKENVAPASTTPAAATETKTETVPTTNGDVPHTNGLTNGTESEAAPKQIGDVVPEAVNIGTPSEQPKVVAASA